MKRPSVLILVVIGLAFVSSCGEQPTTENSTTKIVVAELDWQGARAIAAVLGLLNRWSFSKITVSPS